MKPTIYLVPRWGGSVHSDWYDWFSAEIRTRYDLSVVVLNMPDWNLPTVEESTLYLSGAIPHINKSTYLIGHSVGCQAVMRYLNARLEQDSSIEIGGILLIAAWFTVDRSWDSINPWQANDGLNYRLLTERIGFKKVILSDNDPFTANYEENKSLWIDRVGASVTVYPQRAHFNAKTELAVLEGFDEMIKDVYMAG